MPAHVHTPPRSMSHSEWHRYFGAYQIPWRYFTNQEILEVIEIAEKTDYTLHRLAVAALRRRGVK